MALAITDLPGLLEGIPPGAWVAVSVLEGKVLSFGDDAEAILQQAREKGEDHPLIVRVPERNLAMFV